MTTFDPILDLKHPLIFERSDDGEEITIDLLGSSGIRVGSDTPHPVIPAKALSRHSRESGNPDLASKPRVALCERFVQRER